MISFTVPGKPQPKGSARAVMTRDRSKAILVPANLKAAGWQAHVTDIAAAHAPTTPITGPVRLTVVFVFARPKSHFRTGNHSHELRDDCPIYHVGKPDLDKLCRTLGDGITNGGVWRDDSQVSQLDVMKRYGIAESTIVQIEPITHGDPK